MKIGITGIQGFLGTHLRKELQLRGYEVVGIDIKKTDGRSGIAQGDLRLSGVAQEWLQIEQPAVLVHMAAQVGRLFSDDDVSHTVMSNAGMTTLVAKACGDLGVELAYTSTSEVYGDNGLAVCDEIEGPWSPPHNLYGLSKLWGEQVAQLYAPENLVIFRPSMPYGPGVPPGRGRAALPNILWQACTGQRIPIHRGAERAWCWVGDTVAGMAEVIERRETGPFNIGRDDNPMSMVKLAEDACEMVGAPLDMIEVIDPPSAQTVVKRLSTVRLRALGWEPTVELEEGMREVLGWVQQFDKDGRQYKEKEAV